MAMKITDDCVMCGACEGECHTNSISEGDDTYIIDASTCDECKGGAGSPQCVEVCPVDAIIKA